MLVTFHTKAWSNITMFGDVAVTLLKMAGHSGTVPSAFRPEDISPALTRLRQALAAIPEEKKAARKSADQNDEDTEPGVGLRTRAVPLIDLLSAAAEQKSEVIWEEGTPVV